MIKIKMSNDAFIKLNADEVVVWCEENIGGSNWKFEIDPEIGSEDSEFFSFVREEDAVAFRLRFGV